jgi:hypothetical protein
MTGGGPAATGLLHDARRGVYGTRPALRGWLHLLCFRRVLDLHVYRTLVAA